MTLMITGVGFLIHVYSISYMREDARFTRFFAFLNFFVAMMLILVLADSYPLMFVGWEGVGMAQLPADRLLVRRAHGTTTRRTDVNNSNAARKAFIMNRIGDLGFMLGMFLIYKVYGTLVIPELSGQEGTLAVTSRPLIELICLFLLVGAVGKSGQLPLTTWLPDAMAGPDARLGPDSRGDDGHGGRVSDRPQQLLLRPGPRREPVGGLGGRADGALRGALGAQPDRHQEDSGLLHRLAARLHVPGGGTARYTAAIFHLSPTPSSRPCCFWRRARSFTRCTRSRTCARWAASPGPCRLHISSR